MDKGDIIKVLVGFIISLLLLGITLFSSIPNKEDVKYHINQNTKAIDKLNEAVAKLNISIAILNTRLEEN